MSPGHSNRAASGSIFGMFDDCSNIDKASSIIEIGRRLEQVGQVRPRHLSVAQCRCSGFANNRDVAELAFFGQGVDSIAGNVVPDGCL